MPEPAIEHHPTSNLATRGKFTPSGNPFHPVCIPTLAYRDANITDGTQIVVLLIKKQPSQQDWRLSQQP
jgi:hypothetical protein